MPDQTGRERQNHAGERDTMLIDTEGLPGDARRPSPAFDPTGQEMRVPPSPARSTGWQRPAMIILGLVVLLVVLIALF